MSCHLLVFLGMLGGLAVVVALLWAFACFMEFLSYKNDWAPWAFIGACVVAALAVAAWNIPCELVK